MTNLIKIPGLIDPHVHLREFGANHKEDFYTGTSAALAGGYVGVVDMPNNPKPTVSLQAIKLKEKLAAKKCVCDYGFLFGADNTNWLLHPKAAKKTFGIKVFMDQTTGPLLVTDLKILSHHFQTWPKIRPIMVHAEDSTLAKAIGLAFAFDKWLHVCHVNKEAELKLIIKAKQKGLTITCETAPHYLILTDKEAKKLWPFSNMRPPLTSINDVKAMWWGINHKIINFVANDHAPHTIAEKKSQNPPCGVPGLETCLPLLLTFMNQKKLTLKRIIELTSLNAQKFLGIKLPNNTYTEVDPKKEWVVKNKDLKTKCRWSLFSGYKMKGKVVRVFIRGIKVFENGKILVKKGFGRHL